MSALPAGGRGQAFRELWAALRQEGYGLKLGERNRILSDCSPVAGTTLLGSALGLVGRSSAWKMNAAMFLCAGKVRRNSFFIKSQLSFYGPLATLCWPH